MGDEVVVNQIDDQVLVTLLRVKVQFIENRIAPHFIRGERFIRRKRLKAAKFSPVQAGHRCDRLHAISGSMVSLLVTFVFLSEFLELLDNLIILSDLLVDRKQHGIDAEARLPAKSLTFQYP